MNLSQNTVFKLNPNVLRRYEINCQDGTLFLFNIDNDELWTGNFASFQILKLLDGKNNLNDIYKQMNKMYNEYDINTVNDSINVVLSELFNKNFIVEVQEKE